jgi:hypothetical protein
MIMSLLGWVLALAADDDVAFFEQRIRPVLVEHCHSCHSPQAKKIKGGLLVDSREALLKGGDTGPALVPGQPEKSLLLEVVSWKNPDLKMPPKSRLDAARVADLAEWVRRGAPWPGAAAAGGKVAPFDLAARRKEEAVWKALTDPPPPAVRDAAWAADPLDRYILAGLEAKGLRPAAPASPRDWIRRVSFDLAGLPPSAAEVDAYVAAPDPAALVDRLLASPRFGETWARHWLDLVRYAETRGHEFDYPIPNAWAYRDYAIRAFNADVPYPQFVREHVAGDLLPEPRLHPTERFNESVLGTGWWFLGEWLHSPVDPRADEMDRVTNQIEAFGKTFLGLTISCARCHDHKFDAISQKDFTALAAYLKSADYRQVRYDTVEDEKRVAAKLEALREAARPRPAPMAEGRPLGDVDLVADHRTPWAQDGGAFHRVLPGDPSWTLDPEMPVAGIHRLPGIAYDAFWDRLKPAPGQQADPGKRNWHDSGRRLRTPEFDVKRGKLYSLVSGSAWAFVSLDSYRMLEGPLHGAVIGENKKPGRHWIVHDLRPYANAEKPIHHAHVEFTPRSPDFVLHLVVQADAPPADPFDGPTLAEPGPVTDADRDRVRARRALSETLRAESRLAPGLVEGVPADERLLVRGFSGTPKDVVPRRFLEALGGTERPGGRLELARDMTDPKLTPMLPRVIVNRLWHHLFGRGIVPSVDDFGRMGLPATHPELLDHLASRFTEEGGSIKRMLRRLALSSTYRMSSVPPPGALEADPVNALRHHHPSRRLPAEALRDAMLAVSGRLDTTMYGPPVAVHLDGFQDGRGKPASGPLDGAGRRSLYLGVRRNFLSSMLLAFDFPQPFSAMGRRSVSNVPAQALILRNHPFVHEQAAVWAKRGGGPTAQRVDGMFRAAFGRPADAAEVEAAAAYVEGPGGSWAGLAHALFQAKEFLFLR